jgi:hypothetical protein
MFISLIAIVLSFVGIGMWRHHDINLQCSSEFGGDNVFGGKHYNLEYNQCMRMNGFDSYTNPVEREQEPYKPFWQASIPELNETAN